MRPYPKPVKADRKKRRQRVLVRYACGCWDMSFRSGVKNCISHSAPAERIYAAGVKYISEHSLLVNILDELASKIVRRRDGHICVLCGGHGSDCGHVFARGMWAVRWDLANMNTLCKSCNYKDSLHAYNYIYKDWYRARYGQKKYDALKERAQSMRGGKEWTVSELRGMVVKFEGMLDALERMSVMDYPMLVRLGYYGEEGGTKVP